MGKERNFTCPDCGQRIIDCPEEHFCNKRVLWQKCEEVNNERKIKQRVSKMGK